MRYFRSFALVVLGLFVLAGPVEAFPTITSTTTSEETANTASHTVSYPATTANGDLLILLFSNDGASDTPTLPGTWGTNELTNGDQGGGGYAVSYLIADGTEGGGSITVTTPSVEQSSAAMLRILAADWHGTTPPEILMGTASLTASPDVGSLSPSWGSEDTLWISLAFRDRGTFTVSTWPLPDNQTNMLNGTSNQGAFSSDELAQASLDPSAWLWSVSTSNIAGVLAVRPAAAATNNSLRRRRSAANDDIYEEPTDDLPMVSGY